MPVSKRGELWRAVALMKRDQSRGLDTHCLTPYLPVSFPVRWESIGAVEPELQPRSSWAGRGRRSSASACCATSASPRSGFGLLPQDQIMRSLQIFADRILPEARDI